MRDVSNSLSRLAIIILVGSAAAQIARVARGECPYFISSGSSTCFPVAPPGPACNGYWVCPGGPVCLGGDIPNGLEDCGPVTAQAGQCPIYLNGTASGSCCTGGEPNGFANSAIWGYWSPVSCGGGGGGEE